jgi:hypothetical protein
MFRATNVWEYYQFDEETIQYHKALKSIYDILGKQITLETLLTGRAYLRNTNISIDDLRLTYRYLLHARRKPQVYGIKNIIDITKQEVRFHVDITKAKNMRDLLRRLSTFDYQYALEHRLLAQGHAKSNDWDIEPLNKYFNVLEALAGDIELLRLYAKKKIDIAKEVMDEIIKETPIPKKETLVSGSISETSEELIDDTTTQEQVQGSQD